MGGNGESPEFKREMVDVLIPVGSSTKFLVEIQSCSEPNVSWFHNDLPVTNSDRYVLLRDKGIFCIQIHQVKPCDEGHWICRASNANESEISCSAVLKLQIPQIYKAPQFVTGLRGCLWDNGTLSLECDVMGVPTPVLRWYRDGKPLDAGSSLTIRAYSKESKSLIGLFACEAENCMGVNATFSRVYAKNFANYLRQIGHIRCTGKKDNDTKAPKSKSSKNDKVVNGVAPKLALTNPSSDNKQREFRDGNNKSDDDSGIADDTHHI